MSGLIYHPVFDDSYIICLTSERTEMKRDIILTSSLFILTLSVISVQANPESKDDGMSDDLKIVVTSLDINDKALNLTYEIINLSEEEVWIYTGGHSHYSITFGMAAGGTSVSEDGLTLTIGSSFSSTENDKDILGPVGSSRYVRLGPGENQKESIFIKLPIHPLPLSDDITRQGQAEISTIQLSYYQGDLPKYFFRVIERGEKIQPIDSSVVVLPGFYSWVNECLTSREDELLIRENLKFEKNAEFQILRTVVDNVQIPYEEMSGLHCEYGIPNLTSCTKVKIQYRPSMLDYFFPFAFQKNLLSPEELKYLESENTLILENIKQIKIFANNIKEADTSYHSHGANVERYRSSIDIVCQYDDKPPMSFFIYNDNAIRVDCDILPCTDGFHSLKTLTPRIKAIDLRMRCAANLKNQWYRFRFYNYTEALCQGDMSIKNQRLYPKPSQWCDDIRRPYPYGADPVRMTRSWNDKPYVCPGAWEGKCHYAMNPNCEPNSPGDMVLLFETDAGWNQHGGPELFTFDNHDPKGGCVLLNDGTVKFIRTKEELNALRWK